MKNQLKEKRKGAGLSQYQLSRLAGVAQGTISNIERGTIMPNIITAYRIAAVLGVLVDDIFIPEPGELPKPYGKQEARKYGRKAINHTEDQPTARTARRETTADAPHSAPTVHGKVKNKK